MNAPPIIFWQRMITPHMAALASALARRGVETHYCAEMPLSPQRAAMGWEVPSPSGVVMHDIPQDKAAIAEMIATLQPAALHISQGLLRNGRIGAVQAALRALGARQWPMLEQVDDRGAPGLLKRMQYGWALGQARHWAEKILAIGAGTQKWLSDRAFPASMTAEFAYFLEKLDIAPTRRNDKMSILFAGRLVPLKRVDLLIAALAQMDGEWTLDIVGDGSQGAILKAFADRHVELSGKISWAGILPRGQLLERLTATDLLVLPSDYDGWGASISEALLAGCRVICSDACGVADVAARSDRGQVVRAGNQQALANALQQNLEWGPMNVAERDSRRAWAHCLSADAGADYLLRLIAGENVPPPWQDAA